MNHYETVFILTPVLSEPQMKEAVEKFKDVIVNNEGRITNEELWGAKKLAYPIQKKTTGYYTLIEFDAEPSMIERLTTAYRRDERVLRFLTFNLDKYAYEYALKRRSVRKAKAEEAAKAEAEAAAEAAEAPAAVEEPAAPAPVEEPAAPAPAEAPAQPEATPEAAPEAEETKE